MPEQIPKEVAEFMTQMGGSLLSALEDAFLEYWYLAHPEARGQFPYLDMPKWVPPLDDLLVAGLALPPWVIGVLVEQDAKSKGDTKTMELGHSITKFGEGGLLYSVPMLVKSDIVNSTVGYPAPAGRGESPSNNSPTQGTRQPAGIVYKL